MNLTKVKKRKGFTLIELMAVIAIISILAAVLVPTVTGYINRAKKTAIITQVRNVISAVETFNATADSSQQIENTVTSESTITNVTLTDVRNKVGSDLLEVKSINKLPANTTMEVMVAINSDTNSIKDITLNKDGVLQKYVRANTATEGSNAISWENTENIKPIQ